MGDVYARVKVYGPRATRELQALVDTGATFTKIPRAVVEEIGIVLVREVQIELANKTSVRRKLGHATVEIEGERDLVPVTVADDGEEPLIGYTTLEILGFKVNPLTRALERARPIEYR